MRQITERRTFTNDVQAVRLARLAACALFTWFTAATATAQNLLVNPSFEQPVLANGTFASYPPNTTIGTPVGTGWVVSPDSTVPGVVPTDQYVDGGAVWPQGSDGNQYVFLGDSGGFCSLYQDVELVASTRYRLDYLIATMGAFQPSNGGAANANVSIRRVGSSEVLVSDTSFVPFDGGSGQFHGRGVDFECPASGTYRLTVSNVSPGYFTNIDNFVLRAVTVPGKPLISLVNPLATGLENMAYAVSRDGSVMAGTSNTSPTTTSAVQWTRGGSPVNIGSLVAFNSIAFAISGDGRVIVGYGGPGGNYVPYRWEGGAVVPIGHLGGNNAVAYGISSDGRVIVGNSSTAGQQAVHAFRWTAEGGMQDLGSLGGFCYGYDASQNGDVVVGWSFVNGGAPPSHSFRWTAAGGLQDIGGLGGTRSEAKATNLDGSVVVGSANLPSDIGRRAFRWTQSGGMVNLGTLGGDAFATGVTGDGRVVVGYYNPPGSTGKPFIWTELLGMKDLTQFLVDRGASLTDYATGNVAFDLRTAQDISEDGSTICGSCEYNGGGNVVPLVIRGLDHQILYVNGTLTSGASNGQDWANAFSGPDALKQALAVASALGAGTEIWVAQGTYRPAGPGGSPFATFDLQGSASLFGGFAGTETSRSQRNVVLHETILSGDLNGDDIGDLNRLENSRSVVRADRASGAAIDGFTIIAGNAASPGSETGGGVLVKNCSGFEIRNCKFEDNRASIGAAVSVTDSSVVLSDCEFVTNLAAQQGGALSLSGGSLLVRRSLFQGNVAGQSGGAIYSTGGVATSVQCRFVRNQASAGGALWAGNPAGGSVGAVLCSFLGNKATSGPGGAVRIDTLGGVPLVAPSSFADCLFAGNASATIGSAISLSGASASLINNTISANRSGAAGGAVAVDIPDALTTIANSVLFHNTAPSGSVENQQLSSASGGAFAVNVSSIEGWTGTLGGVGTDGLNPLFLRLPAPGADGAFGTIDDDYGDLRLGFGSPAIDAGDSQLLPSDLFDVDADGNTTESLPLDLVGFPRFVDDPAAPNSGPGTAPHADRGVYESQVNCLTCPGTREWRSPIGGPFAFPGNWFPSVPSSVHETQFNLNSTYSITFPTPPGTLVQNRSATFADGQVTLELAGDTYRLTTLTSTALTVAAAPGEIAELTVRGGTVRAASVKLGADVDSRGTLSVSGPGARLVVPDDILHVGFLGEGALNITGGATALSRFASIGFQPGSFGQVLVDGPGSSWTVPFTLTINNGRLTVRNGGTVTTSFGIFVGQNSIVDGDGTINGDLINFGSVSPGNSPGMLTVAGDYVQQGEIAELGGFSGKLTMQVAGTNPGQFDRLVVTGQTQLGGGLIIQGATPTSALPIPPEGLSLPLIDALGGIGTDSATGQLRNRFDVAFFPRVPGANNGPSDKFLRLAQAEGGGARFFNLVDGTLGAPINVNDPTNTGAAGTPSAVAAGDLDGDGLDDLAITTASSNIVTILMNRGTIAGEWQGFEGAVQFNTGSNPQGLAIGDIDGDGMKDLAIANQGANSVSLLKNATVPMSHAAAFTGQGSLATGTGPVGIVVENFDGGGTRPVIVTADELGGGLSIFIRSNGPGFGFPPRVPKQLPVNFPPAQPACIDIDGDMQRPDLAVRSRSGNAVLILQNLSNGTGNVNFADAIVLPVGNSPESMQVAKLANGKSSLVTANSGSNTISVLVNTAGPGNPLRFAPAVDLPAGTMPLSIASLDVDGDTDGDLAVLTNTGTGNNPIKVRLLRNDFIVGAAQGNDQPTFVIDRDLPDEGAPTDALFVISANLVSPTTTDLLTINRQGGGRGPGGGGGNLMDNIRPRLNTTQGGVNTCPQDFNGDGEVNPDDLADFIGCFFSQPPCPTSDYNQSGETDPDDLADFIGAYFGLGC